MPTTAGNDVVTVIDAHGLIEPRPAVVAVEALEQLLLGREITAERHLATVTDRAGRLVMSATLVAIAAGALDALRDRARYRVDTELVLSWLGPVDGAAHDACWVVLQRAAFHSAGLEMPSATPTDGELSDELAAALLVARGVVELVARRRWLRPTAMLSVVLGQLSLRRRVEPDQASLDAGAHGLEP